MRIKVSFVLAAVIVLSAAGWLVMNHPSKKSELVKAAPSSPSSVSTTSQLDERTDSPSGTPNARQDFAPEPPSYLMNFRRVKALADGGDVVALRQLSEIYESCSLYSANPIDYEEGVRKLAELNRDLKAAASMRMVASSVAARCNLLSAEIPGKSAAKAASGTLNAAAIKGDLAANIKIAATSDRPLSSRELDTLVDAVRAADDPSAIFALGALMGIGAPSDSQRYSSVSGSQLWGQSWEIAACRLGANCSSGLLMENICLNFGACSYSSYDQFIIEGLLSPADRPTLEANVNEIASLIRDDR